MSFLVSPSRAGSGSFSTISSGSTAMGREVLDQICETRAGHSHCEDSGAYVLRVLCNDIIKVTMVSCEMVVLSGDGGQDVLREMFEKSPLFANSLLFSLILQLAWKMRLHQGLGKQESAVIFKVLVCDFMELLKRSRTFL